MTTIIRVKRHRSEDPVEALVLSCKRKKTEDSDSDLFQKVLNFSGTVEEKDDKVATSTVESFHKDSKYANFKKTHKPEIRAKQRQEKKERREDDRFLLLSCLRAGSGGENSKVDASAHSKENITIVDVSKETKEEEELKENGTSDVSYVYDLYSLEEYTPDFNDLFIQNLLSIQPLAPNFDNYWNVDDLLQDVDDIEDDSNDENNWRNDYPETESSQDEEDDILSKQLRNCHLGKTCLDLSDDSGDEDYLHYNDNERYYYCAAENIAGEKYAKYKANTLRHLMHDDDSGDSDDSDDAFCDCHEYRRGNE